MKRIGPVVPGAGRYAGESNGHPHAIRAALRDPAIARALIDAGVSEEMIAALISRLHAGQDRRRPQRLAERVVSVSLRGLCRRGAMPRGISSDAPKLPARSWSRPRRRREPLGIIGSGPRSARP